MDGVKIWEMKMKYKKNDFVSIRTICFNQVLVKQKDKYNNFFLFKKNDYVNIASKNYKSFKAIILSKSKKDKRFFLQIVDDEFFSGKIFIEFDDIKEINKISKSELLWYLGGKDQETLKCIKNIIK